MNQHHEQTDDRNRRQDHAQQRINKELPLFCLDASPHPAPCFAALALSSAKCGSIQSRKITSVRIPASTSRMMIGIKGNTRCQQHRNIGMAARRYLMKQPPKPGHERKRNQHHHQQKAKSHHHVQPEKARRLRLDKATNPAESPWCCGSGNERRQTAAA